MKLKRERGVSAYSRSVHRTQRFAGNIFVNTKFFEYICCGMYTDRTPGCTQSFCVHKPTFSIDKNYSNPLFYLLNERNSPPEMSHKTDFVLIRGHNEDCGARLTGVPWKFRSFARRLPDGTAPRSNDRSGFDHLVLQCTDPDCFAEMVTPADWLTRAVSRRYKLSNTRPHSLDGD